MFDRMIGNWRSSIERSAGSIAFQVALVLALLVVGLAAIGFFMTALFIYLMRHVEADQAALLCGLALLAVGLVVAIPLVRKRTSLPAPPPPVEPKEEAPTFLAGLTAGNIIGLLPVMLSRPRLSLLAAAAAGLYFGWDHLKAKADTPPAPFDPARRDG
ncbi:hypothetical protein [Zavarzinia sp. CC-PAN008]|uniref:hypothetical protein n=1 Tax=Zavarzinia sp. CC-PAN008 TaxID=3243332 RepID=UPI003F74739F